MRALIISSDRFEDSELAQPLRQLQAKGVEVDIAAPKKGLITGKHGHKVSVGLALDAVRPEDYGLLLLPGGKAPASLRKDPEAVAIARHFLQADKPVAAICHGPQVLIATGLLAGRTATCYRDMRQELEAAGVEYLDREVVVDDNLITSRQPADIPAFMRAIFGIMGLSR
ncbi:MAG: type 1 glutamine amidotransferase [Alphaproteobacteria bacterium]|nr:type 1 glutamine amidotransferase [Alphaproteobacteria bacterium]MCK5623919.1 type 1 glutamine amidotransferase [Alphaproteobacteria bacterium]